MDIRAPLVTDRQPLEPVQPGDTAQRAPAFHYPPMPPQPLLALHSPPRDSRHDMPRTQRPLIQREILSLVRVQLRRSLTAS